MAKAPIPVYDICSIDQKRSQKDLLVERFDSYLASHYHNLHCPHRHSFFHLVLFTKGKGSHTIDFEKFTIRPFQMYFMAPGQVHSWHFEPGVEGYIVHFNEELFSAFLQNAAYLDRFQFFSGRASDGICQIPVSARDHVISLFESTLDELKSAKESHLDVIRLRLLDLFITVQRTSSGRKASTIPGQKSLLLRTFLQLISKHFRTLKLPKEYAELLYITPNHLNALCGDLLGKTAGDLIRERVLLEAKRLLTNADMTVAEIAYDLNFQDNSYFNRFFKKAEGMTPDEFRKKFFTNK